MTITRDDFDYILVNKDKKEFFVRVDFGLTQASVRIKDETAYISGRYRLPFTEKIKPNFCYRLTRRGPEKIAFFSEKTNRFYKLLPTRDWPTVVISSSPMHRVTRSSPKEDTRKKIALLKPFGKVLDTCMGLGYTALCAARNAKEVVTLENDACVYAIAKLNPFSRQLFVHPNIRIVRADTSRYLSRFTKGSFDCIIHDPPTFSIAPGLYSVDFYKRLKYTLQPKGKLCHYAPLYGIRRGINFPVRIKGKLKQAGFKVIAFAPNEGGILCRT